jgi:isopentenyl diphosphate isomerase/L-lactate dehydrogenase-like FMN-dependent dehydrogenase
MLSKVKSAGFKAVVVTVDAFYAARRERMINSKFMMPDYVRMGNLLEIQKNPKYRRPDGSIKRMILTWSDLRWIKESSRLPIIIKGIMSAEDAFTALEYDIAGIIVSNHGGRQLDDTPSTLDCLNLISKKIGKNSDINLLVDGGIYRGVDVLKAMAYGAKAVLIGRPYVYALAARGQYGIESVLQMFLAEIDNAMSQLGISSLDELNGSFLYKENNSNY